MEKLSRKNQKALRKTADEFIDAITEKVNNYVILGDVDSLGQLVKQVEILGGYEIIDALKKKGLSKDITALCDKAGQITSLGVKP